MPTAQTADYGKKNSRVLSLICPDGRLNITLASRGQFHFRQLQEYLKYTMNRKKVNGTKLIKFCQILSNY